MTQSATEGSAPDDAPAHVDLYREVHKGLRYALFEVVERAGSLDVADVDDLASFRELFADLDMMLRTHHAHEEGATLAAMISSYAPDCEAELAAAHEQSEERLGELRSMVADLHDAADAAALYDRLALFTTDYLAHMRVEEHDVMPRLRAGATAEDLMAVTMAIRTSVPPPVMCVFLRSMLPAMNQEERTAMLGGMKAGAPPEVFDLFWDVAGASLPAPDLATIAGGIGASAARS